MTDKALARDGYSAGPALLRAIGMALVAAILVFAEVPRWLPVLMLLGALGELGRYAVRRRERSSIESRRAR